MQNVSFAPYTPPTDLPVLKVSANAALRIRRARVDDIPRLYHLINYYAARGDMLPKTLDLLYNRVREFHVAEAGGEVVGCAALKITWQDLAEIVSVVIHPDFQGRGLGRHLIEPLFDEARDLGIPTLFVLTLQVGFFSRLGFREVPRLRLPHKIWQDCSMCFKRDRCDEIAMVRDM
ncbi:MAG: N-acetyltransferase [Chloroflexaceae bacterium]|nr:N-acetyltransferase [Chloroflexaceae bacterium]NJO82909.1 N-acetyltransferase [Blastochloris sp.]